MRKIQKVLLIFPPGIAHPQLTVQRASPPLGLAYLAAAVADDVEVEILDAVIEAFENRMNLGGGYYVYGLGFEDIREKIESYSPDLVGVSSLFTEERRNAHRVCAMAKSVDPDILTVMGGVHPTVLASDVMSDPNVDYVVIGEGEETFRALIRKLNSGQSIAEIDGLAFRDAGEIRINPKTSYIQNLDSVPLPARHKIPLLRYSTCAEKAIRYPAKAHPYTTLLSSRGCPAKCIFCSSTLMYGPKFRPRSPASVLGEIEQLIARWGIRELDFFDDNLTYQRDRAMAIFDGMIEHKMNLHWVAGNGLAIYSLDDELLEKMKASGCYRVHIAVESGVQKVLSKIIRKPLDLKRVPGIVKKAQSLGMETVGFFVIGFPGETMKEIRQTAAFAEQLEMDYVTFQIASPHPGTRLYEVCKQNGYLTPDFSLDNLSTSVGHIITGEFAPEALERIRVLEWDRINFRSESQCAKLCAMMGLTRDELEKRRKTTRERLAKYEIRIQE
jgi:magnesium-protoporphyrin IX monomethyl ester (oxidative) cyclase